VVSRHNADIADTLHLRDVAMATTFCLLMRYNFGCRTASDMADVHILFVIRVVALSKFM